MTHLPLGRHRMRARQSICLAMIGLILPYTQAREVVHLEGYVAVKTVDCLHPGHHHHEPEYYLVDDATGRRIQLPDHDKRLKQIHPRQKVRVVGRRGDAKKQNSARKDEGLEVVEMELLPMPKTESVDPPVVAYGGNQLTMLSTLLVFISTDTHGCMTSETNARNRLFNNTTNANLGMQAITKGRYGLQLGNGTGVPDDHTIDLKLNVDSADHDTGSIESLALNKLFVDPPSSGGLGLTRLDWDRILLFAPAGITDAGFTAYAYYPWGSYTTKGMISMYGNSYGNNRMNGYLHELGHNFGFAHSSKGTSEYGDRTCVMGLSNDGTRTETYGASKLLATSWLNAFPNATLALTTDRTFDLHPLSSDPDTVSGTIAVSIPGTDYFVAYHRNDLPYGYLSQTADRDRVFVYTRASGSFERSFQVANLVAGSSFNGPGEIRFDRYGPNNEYATISIDLNDGNAKPVANAATFGTVQNSPVAIVLTGSDADNNPLTFSKVGDPANGTLSGTPPDLTYTPDPGFTGTDSFVFKAHDGLISDFATVTIEVYVDSDNDGLEDAWEMQYFGNLSQGAAGNPDGDQEDNLTEFLNGNDPTRAPTLFARLTGTVIGSPGSYLNDPSWDKDEAFDGDLATFYDAMNASGDWTGLDLGSPRKVGSIKYAPRSTWPTRMTGGKFQASNTPDFSSGVVTFHTVAGTPVTGVLTEQTVNDAGSYRYVRYLGPDNGYCNVAEVQFIEDGGPDVPTGLVSTSGGGTIELNWNDNGDADFASYNIYRGNSNGTYGLAPIATGVTQSQYSDSDVTNGVTYFYVVSAVDNDGLQSANSSETSATYLINDHPPVVSAGPDQSLPFEGTAPWTPADLTTVVGWYDASDSETITQSAGAVSVWEDKSSQAAHLGQNTPTLQPRTDAAAINGLPVVKFDGSNDTLVSSSNPYAPTISDAMVIAVHRVDGTQQGTLFNISGTSNNTGRWQAHAPYGSTFYFDAGAASGGARMSAPYGVATGESVLLCVYSSSTQNIQEVHKNGAFFKGDSTGQDTSTAGNITVGSGVATQYQNTSIGEMLMLRGVVSPEERQSLEGYLAHKWGLAGDLPAEHPHKSSPPGASGITVALEGSVIDADGVAPEILWTVVSGPAPVIFGSPSGAATTATFGQTGTYVLRLTADDGLYQVFDEITITITDGGIVNGNIDSDGDGVLDFFEYLYGSDPDDASDSGFRIEALPAATGGGAAFRWEVLSGFTAGTHYRILVSTDLGTWGQLPEGHYTLQQSEDAGRTRLELTLTHNYGDRVFIRLAEP